MNNKGSILAIAIIFIFIFVLLGMFSMRLVILQNESSDSELYYTRTHFAALYGTEIALYRIMQWENIPTNSPYLNPAGRKFLAENTACLNYSAGKWYPLKGYTGNPDINNRFSDSLVTSDRSGILLECEVEEEVESGVNPPDPNDGVIPDTSPTSLDRRFGTYRFYVIRTVATMYSDAVAKTGAIASAADQLHFFIAYSSGTQGAAGILDITEEDGTIVPHLPYPSGFYPPSATATVANFDAVERKYVPQYIVSARYRSMATGKVQPIFRYYIRGRR